MTHRRLAELLLCHALADGEPAGSVLRSLVSISAVRAAPLADAGELERALGLVGFPKDQVWIAMRWPRSLRPALERLARLPEALVFEAPLLQALAYFTLIATLQLAAVILLQKLVVHTLVLMPMSSLAPGSSTLFFVALADLLLIGAALALAVWVLRSSSPGARPLAWRASLLLAREAALAASLHDCDAPEQLLSTFVRSCTRLQGRGVSPLELELIFEQALAEATVSLQRFVSGLRVGGYAALTVLALVALQGILHCLAQMGGYLL